MGRTVYESQGKILAAMPYHLWKKISLKIILQPQPHKTNESDRLP